MITTAATLVLIGLVICSYHSYLLFHSLVEIFSILVAWGIFAVAWNSRRFMDNNYLLFVGIAYLFVAFIDLLHTLSYKGMGVFPDAGANLPTQLWIAARYMESISLVLAPLYLDRAIDAAKAFFSYLGATFLLITSIFFFKIFPDCFVAPGGLTSFKIISEYIIALMLLVAIVLLIRSRYEIDSRIFKLMIASIILTIGAELAFTFYISVYGLSNLVGHMLKLISFFLIYRAIIENGLKKPYGVLFRNLKASEETLRGEKDRLEKALAEIKTLSGLLPICSHCKKIRDDQGYWNQIEAYIGQRSSAEFTHGICPDCMERLYQDLADHD